MISKCPGETMTRTKLESFLKRIYNTTGISSQNELTSALSINRAVITQARKKDSIPDKWILQLYRSFGMSPDWVKTGAGHIFHQQPNANEDLFANVPK